eukprot:6190644-Pleurochrysis_carterae.AAC.2
MVKTDLTTPVRRCGLKFWSNKLRYLGRDDPSIAILMSDLAFTGIPALLAVFTAIAELSKCLLVREAGCVAVQALHDSSLAQFSAVQ